MNILIEGDSLAGYLAKCHEAYRTGLRAFGAVAFGEGYTGFDSSIKSYSELIQKLYSGDEPDLLMPFYEMVLTYPNRFRYADLSEIKIPKGIFIGDSWYITENYKNEFIDIIEGNGIDFIFSYFPLLTEEYNGTKLEDKIIFTPPCMDPAIFNANFVGGFSNWESDRRYDVGFLAAGTTEYSDTYPERYCIHNQLLNRHDLKYLWAEHPGWEINNDKHRLVGRNFSKAIASCKIFITSAGKMRHPNPKYVEIMASGACLFSERPLGAEELGLVDGTNYVEITANNVQDKIDYYLKQPEKLFEIAEAGYKLTMSKHSCYARALDIINTVSKKQSNRTEIKGESKGAIMTTTTINPQDDNNLVKVPQALLLDDNHVQEIALPQTMKELPQSSSPQFTLYRLVRHLKPKRILEIGSQTGASAIAVALAQRDNGMKVDVTCIDPFIPCGDNDGWDSLHAWYSNVQTSGYLGKGIDLMLTTSDRVLPETKRKYDFVIIDGSHAYEDVKYDLTNVLPITELGGYIWMHDYMIYESVRSACNEGVEDRQLPFSVNEIQTNARGDLCGWALLRNLPYQHIRGHSELEIKLNLGCGGDYKEDCINIDTNSNTKADIHVNFLDIDKIFEAGSVSEVTMIHSLGYLNLWQAKELMQKVHKLLKPGGKIITEMPNLERAVEKITSSNGKFDDYIEGVRSFHAFGLDNMEQKQDYTPYAFSWTPTHLARELENSGFNDVSVLPPETHAKWRDMRIEARRK